MAEVILKAEPRTLVGKKVKALRRAGYLPGVLYGSGVESSPLQMDLHETTLSLRDVTATTLITLELGGKSHKALVRDKQYDYLRSELTHIDFLAVSMTEKLRVEVQLEFVGQSPAIENFGGVLVTNMSHLNVECLPSDLVDTIHVDISSLENIGDSISVNELVVPDSLTVLTDLDEMVAVIAAPRAEVEEEEEEELEGEFDETEPEVIEKGRREEEEED